MASSDSADSFSSETTFPCPEQRQVLLAEYEAAPSSAQHHDTLLWSATYTIWSGNVVLLSGVLFGLSMPKLWPLLSFACAVGITLLYAADRFAHDFRAIKNQKYDRCKEIEGFLGMQQHRRTTTRVGRQAELYTIINLLLGGAWLITLELILLSRLL
jgi:hypothetical protein